MTLIDALYGAASISSPPLPTAVGLLCIGAGIISQTGMMPVFRKPRPLWNLLVMLGCAIVAPLLLLGAYAGYRTGETQLREVRENLTIEARTLSASVDREMIGEMERLQALAASPSLHRGDFAEFRRQAEVSLSLRHSLQQAPLKGAVDPKEGAIILIDLDRDMQQLVNTRQPIGARLPKTGVPKRVIATALATGKPQVSGLMVGASINELVVSIVAVLHRCMAHVAGAGTPVDVWVPRAACWLPKRDGVVRRPGLPCCEAPLCRSGFQPGQKTPTILTLFRRHPRNPGQGQASKGGQSGSAPAGCP